MGFADPSLEPGSPDEQRAAFRRVRDAIRTLILPFLEREAANVTTGL